VTKVVVPAGFEVSTFASGLEHPTAMAWGPDDRL
jgi:glucose/arabinose dehydrogenase